ncbi:hypothetical protein [Rhodococcus sp. WAY2]|jgi:hypothetical protein|uniref:hypothetical protein n=1 Tax=Rhodococcus sp. WAY2 TaxID=2663121 RepID=UPI00135B68E5|nr:hypothetical protein [Rhodococcus sp. WAY2]
MRAELALFRRRLEEQRVRDEAEATRRRQLAGRPADTSTAADAVAPRRSAAEDDDEFYRPRSWLVE